MSFLAQFRPAPAVLNGQSTSNGFSWSEFSHTGQGYAEAAMARECDEVVRAPQGRRNHTLNAAAFSLGQLVAGGALSQDRVAQALMDAALRVGLTRQETEATIASGLRSGAQSPRGVPERPGGLFLPRGVEPHADPADPTDEDPWLIRAVPGGTFVLDTPDTPPAVWGAGEEIGWAQGEALMLCGPAGVGKTTVAVQLVAARLGIGMNSVFGLPVCQGARRVLYLAMDRPPQISRAMARLFTDEDRKALDDKLMVWKGPPLHDLAKHPDMLAMMADRAGADTVVVDSLKDGVLKLSEDESGGGYNRARQRALVEGIEVLELHHQRKAGGENKKPTKLDDVYGSTWITAGAGSVFLFWGEPGDPIVEMLHLKQPSAPLGPWMVAHDHERGRSELHHPTDVLTLVRNQRRVGMTARLLATQMFFTDKPTASHLEKARRKLVKLAEAGHLAVRPGTGRDADLYFVPDLGFIDGGEHE